LLEVYPVESLLRKLCKIKNLLEIIQGGFDISTGGRRNILI